MFKRELLFFIILLLASSAVQGQSLATEPKHKGTFSALSDNLNLLEGDYIAWKQAIYADSIYDDPVHIGYLDHEHEHEHAGHHEGLHFSHPLIAESVSPDTKLRLDYDYVDVKTGVSTNSVTLSAEYAFHRSFSIEVGLPYEVLNTAAGSTESRFSTLDVSFKFANYAFEKWGLLLGYGMELGLPTGNDEIGIGSDDIVELEPFLNFGLKKGNWEWVGFTTFGIPTNQETDQEIETELGLNVSSLYHFSTSFQALLELDGEKVLSSEEAGGDSEYFLTPGVKLAPLANKHIIAGVGLRFPITADAGSDFRTVLSVFYHF